MSGNAGRAWVFGDDIDTDVLAPGPYLSGSVDELAQHCLEVVDPTFATDVASGDIVVAGRNFGMGSSREQAARALHHLGDAAVLAQSFAGIFYRNALNLGLLVLICPETDKINPNDRLEVDGEGGKVRNLTTDDQYNCEPVPPHLMQMVRDGGLVPHLEKMLAERGKAGS